MKGRRCRNILVLKIFLDFKLTWSFAPLVLHNYLFVQTMWWFSLSKLFLLYWRTRHTKIFQVYFIKISSVFFSFSQYSNKAAPLSDFIFINLSRISFTIYFYQKFTVSPHIIFMWKIKKLKSKFVYCSSGFITPCACVWMCVCENRKWKFGSFIDDQKKGRTTGK